MHNTPSGAGHFCSTFLNPLQYCLAKQHYNQLDYHFIPQGIESGLNRDEGYARTV